MECPSYEGASKFLRVILLCIKIRETLLPRTLWETRLSGRKASGWEKQAGGKYSLLREKEEAKTETQRTELSMVGQGVMQQVFCEGRRGYKDVKRSVSLQGEEEIEGDPSYSSFSCWSSPRAQELICVMN